MTESNPADDNQFQVEIISPQPENKCFNLKSFAVIVGFANLLIFSVNSYLGSQITTIEKRFNLASSDSGLLMSGNDIGFLVTSLFLTYLLKDTHRPKLLGISGVLSGLACMICSLPHFVTPKSNAETTSNISAIIVEKELSYCESSMNANETCAQNEVDETTYSKNIAFGLILMSTFFIGVCKSPRTALTTAYIDDNTESVYTNAYISIVTAIGVIGPVLAFIIGGMFSRIYVTLEHKKKEIIKKQTRKLSVKDLLLTFGRFFQNPMLIIIALETGINSFNSSGGIAFLPKYFEHEFRWPTWKANIIFGSTLIVMASVGFLFGGTITSFFKMGPKACLKFSVFALFFRLCLYWFCLIDFCPDLETRSNTLLKRSTSLNLTNGFDNTSIDPNAYCLDCECSEDQYEPVCGEDGQMFRSPCYAGCRVKNIKTLTFSDCACVGGNRTAKSGLCPVKCEKDFLVPVILSIVAISSTISLASNTIVVVRSVKESDKTMAISFFSFISSIIGWLPAPPAFGYVVDSSCKTWSKLACEQKGACKEYDMDTFRYRFFLLQCGLSSLAFLLKFVAAVIGLKSKRYFTEEKSEINSAN
ncbi:solute carrier organic anion transporter family member 2A1 isoform X2 [Octopus bimaculoides]|uniref:solute carrier organic anion transporter family member 2A1 isoform X2 n=1 Tax=Octopus bimaculoides TaxID=37653 RepID=UPI0022DF4736|nr:solute carrier organic anion transporter family member 2A1 isoform X2 [Octopus bimaculoides]